MATTEGSGHLPQARDYAWRDSHLASPKLATSTASRLQLALGKADAAVTAAWTAALAAGWSPGQLSALGLKARQDEAGSVGHGHGRSAAAATELGDAALTQERQPTRAEQGQALPRSYVLAS